MPSAAAPTGADIAALLPRLRRFARALTGHPADADDVVQIAVERALMRIDQFQPGTKLEAWLLSIVRNAWIDEARSRTRRGKVFAASELGERVGFDGAGAANDRLDANDVWSAMRRLPEEQREAFLAQPLKAFTPHTVTDPARLKAILARIRQDGYAVLEQEYVLGGSATAAPVFQRDGTVVAALNVGTVSSRYATAKKQIIAAVVQAAGRISQRLGYRRAA